MTTRRKILFSCLFAYLLLDAYQAIAVSMDYLKMFNNSHGKLTPNGQEAWNIFYSMQLAGPNNKIWMYFISLILVPTIFSWTYIYMKNSYFENMIITRKPYRQLVLNSLKSIVLKIFLLKVIIIFLELLIISGIFHTVDFSMSTTFNQKIGRSYIVFSNNILMNFIMYILFSTVGWSLWCALFYSVFLFIKKTILILPATLLLDVFLIIIPAVTETKNSVVKILMYLPFIGNLQSPGNITIGGEPSIPLAIICLFTILFYIVITYILFFYYIKSAQKGRL